MCNEIRVILSKRKKLRWCGAEYESLFNREIVQNASEINGLAELGRKMSVNGLWSGDYPDPRLGDHTLDVINECLRFSDPGQRKLCALFHSIAIPHSTLVYVGSSPGEAWLSALRYYRNIHKVISVDPRVLAGEIPSNVTHHMKKIGSADDLYSLIKDEKNCVLLWDVRGDSDGSEKARDEVILLEITILNNILQDSRILERCFLLHLKINLKHAVSYYLPEGGNFYVQPYTVSRDVYEARYVKHMRESAPITYTSLSVAARESLIKEMSSVREALAKGDLHEFQLVCNVLTARFRKVDYLFEPAYNDSEEEIFLFTINHNNETKILSHLKRLQSGNKRYIVSFFTGEAKGEDPYDFPEGEVLLKELGTVLDTRSFVRAKLEGLYFLVSDHLNDLFREEEFTSETFRIRKTEYSVVSRSRIPVYDEVRNKACQESGVVFPKFPNEFSIADALVSPSGHALRMVLEFVQGKASIAMFAQKIISNFRSVSKSYVKKTYADRQIKVTKSAFMCSLRHNGELRSSLERSTRGIWHSVREWIIGIDAAVRMSALSQHQKEQIESIKKLSITVLNCPLPGIEISSFYANAFGTMSPLASARRGRSAATSEDNLDDPHTLCMQMWNFLSSQEVGYPVKWLTRMDSHANSRGIWKRAIKEFRADALIRDFVCHKAYIDRLSSEYPNHDASKLSPLEFTLSCYARSRNVPPAGCFLLHYWSNSHHPEHRLWAQVAKRLVKVY